VDWTPIEPAAELAAILDRDGPGGAADPLAEQLARDALFASTVDRSNESLAALDETVCERMLVIPLWRLSEYLAYHKSLHGVGERPVTLYQNVEQWGSGQ
jgi:ABC-type oligopeptide transport system substrate-binding subunit